MPQQPLKQTVLKEAALFFGLLFVGFVIVPVAVYLIGPRVFGEFGGHGYGEFFGALSARVRSGNLTAWFFVLAPYLAWQVLRLTAYGWRRASQM